jgi:hypothetical protein
MLKISLFLAVVKLAFLQGVTRNPRVFAWCFCGEFVVEDGQRLVG